MCLPWLRNFQKSAGFALSYNSNPERRSRSFKLASNCRNQYYQSLYQAWKTLVYKCLHARHMRVVVTGLGGGGLLFLPNSPKWEYLTEGGHLAWMLIRSEWLKMRFIKPTNLDSILNCIQISPELCEVSIAEVVTFLHSCGLERKSGLFSLVPKCMV